MSRTLKNSSPCKHCGELKVPGGALVAHERSCANGGATKRKRTKYREIFLSISGAGPYECFFACGTVVEFHELIVHHVDGDHTNNSIKNLVACHRVCHNGHHFTELWATRKEDLMASPTRGHRVPHSQETKSSLSKHHKLAGYAPTDEAREKARIVNTGKKRSEETRKKISEGHKRRALRAQEVMPHED